jgi:putative methyltransferase (TIGR04325 family)
MPRVSDLIPPLVARSLAVWRGGANALQGNYATWADAARAGTLYEAAEILARVEEATLQVERGEAAFERDSIAFQTMELPFPLLASLLRAAISAGGRLRVIDFGGSLGSTYRQCRAFLSVVTSLRWSVIEQAHFVDRGRARFQTDELRFHGDLGESVREAAPDVVLASGVLQYLEDPYRVLDDLAALGARMIVVDRTPWAERSDDIITLQAVPAEIFPARLPLRVFGRGRIAARLAPRYGTVAEFQTVDPDMHLGSVRVRFGGWIFEPGAAIKT